MKTLPKIFLMLALAASMLSVGGCAQASAPPTAAASASIRVSFKLDSRLTGGPYGGEIWVSPSTYTGATAQDTVEARAFTLDAHGQAVPIIPEWTPADPEMVTVSPTQGNQVTITVKRAGETSLQVTSQGMSKTLSIKATYQNNFMQVEISQ